MYGDPDFCRQDRDRLASELYTIRAANCRLSSYKKFCSRTNKMSEDYWEVVCIFRRHQCDVFAPYIKIVAGENDVLSRKLKKQCDVFVAVIKAYTSDYPLYPPLYKRVNQALMNDDEKQLEVNGGYVWFLREAIKLLWQAYGMPQCKVYRGTKIAPKFLSMYTKRGFRFLWPSFVSTSKSVEVARKCSKERGGNVLFVIDLEQGSGTTYAVDIQRISVIPQEEEVLLYPYSGYEVLAAQYNHEEQMHEIFLRSVDTLEIERVDAI
jgi:hypothetical protein